MTARRHRPRPPADPGRPGPPGPILGELDPTCRRPRSPRRSRSRSWARSGCRRPPPPSGSTPAGRCWPTRPSSLTINRRTRRFSYTVVSQVPSIDAADPGRPVDYQDYPAGEALPETGTRTGRRGTGRRWSRPRAPTPPSRRRRAPGHPGLPAQPEFRYNLSVPTLSAGGNQRRRFPDQVREGYCEQFAIAMAMMARQSDPPRVAVGFTSGEIVDRTVQQVTTHDAHAWPELWFPEAGWCRSSRPRGPTAPSRCPPTPPRRPVRPARRARSISRTRRAGRDRHPQHRTPEPRCPRTPTTPAPAPTVAGWSGRSSGPAWPLCAGAAGPRGQVVPQRPGLRRRPAAARRRGRVCAELASWAPRRRHRPPAGGDAGRLRRPPGRLRRRRRPAGRADRPVRAGRVRSCRPGADQADTAKRLARSARASLAGRSAGAGVCWPRSARAACSPVGAASPAPTREAQGARPGEGSGRSAPPVAGDGQVTNTARTLRPTRPSAPPGSSRPVAEQGLGGRALGEHPDRVHHHRDRLCSAKACIHLAWSRPGRRRWTRGERTPAAPALGGLGAGVQAQGEEQPFSAKPNTTSSPEAARASVGEPWSGSRPRSRWPGDEQAPDEHGGRSGPGRPDEVLGDGRERRRSTSPCWRSSAMPAAAPMPENRMPVDEPGHEEVDVVQALARSPRRRRSGRSAGQRALDGA